MDADARRRAEEWIAKHDGRVIRKKNGDDKLMVTSLELLLADAVAQALRDHHCEGCRGHEAYQWQQAAQMQQKDRFAAAAEVARLRAALQAEREGIDEIVNEWTAAYPEEVFREFTAADHPNVSPDRIAAAMARHMVREMRKQIEALRAGAGGKHEA